MKKIFAIEPNIETSRDFDYCSKILREIKDITVITLCSEVQNIYFKNQGFETLDLGHDFFSLNEREAILKKIGDAEKKAYLDKSHSVLSFPFNPFVISGGPTNLRTFHVFSIIKLFDYCLESKVDVIYFSGSTIFKNIIHHLANESLLNIRIKEIKIKSKKNNAKILEKYKRFLKNVLNLFGSVFSKKPLYVFYPSKNVRYFLSIKEDAFFYFSPYIIRFFILKFLNKKKHIYLEKNTHCSYSKIEHIFDTPLLMKALKINHRLIVAMCYQDIIDTVMVFKLILRLKKDVFYLSDFNHGPSNLFINLFNNKQTIFVQHAVIPGANRAGVLKYVEAKKVFLYSKFETGSLAIEAPNCEDIKYIPYIGNSYRTNLNVVNRDILFAPTTEGYFLSDYEYNMLIETCERINEYCEKLSINLWVKLHKKTPYCEFILNKLNNLSRVKIIQNIELSQAIDQCGILISSVNSNTIIEGFLGQKPVIIYNNLNRHNYIGEYESNFCETFNIRNIIEKIDCFNNYPYEVEKLLITQNQFIEKYIQY
ncbi:MAG: hypothetical protein ACKV1O_25265 [Saprospiraceae bacterium]